MLSLTWTPDALSREARALSGVCWRLVEAQHRVSTMKVVDTPEEQAVLEDAIEASKPPLPPECRHLDYLLSTPFRYPALYPSGSRFRRAGLTEGVFYASEEVETAVTEMAFRRLLFFAESPDTPWPANPAEYTAFSAAYQTRAGIDLTAPPFAAERERWRHPRDYSHCQSLAESARRGAIEAIRYGSARCAGINLALLTCGVFKKPKPVARQTWRIHLQASGVQVLGEMPRQRRAFDRGFFAADERIAGLRWQR
jgi:hypothetical protein